MGLPLLSEGRWLDSGSGEKNLIFFSFLNSVRQYVADAPG